MLRQANSKLDIALITDFSKYPYALICIPNTMALLITDPPHLTETTNAIHPRKPGRTEYIGTL